MNGIEKQEEVMQWSTRGMLVRHHTQLRRLAADKRTTMEKVLSEALEIGLGVIEARIIATSQHGGGYAGISTE